MVETRSWSFPADLGIGRLFEHVRDAVVVVDSVTCQIVLWNPAAAQLFGYSAEEAMGLPATILVPEHLRPEHLSDVAGCPAPPYDAAGDGTVVEVPARHKSGAELTVELSLNPLDVSPCSLPLSRLPEGRFVLAIIRDVTDRRRTADALRFQQILMQSQTEASIDGMLVVSREGKILSYNRRFVEMWGIPPEVMASGSDEVALQWVEARLLDPQEFLARVAYLYAHPSEESRDEVRLKDGQTFDRYSAPVANADGENYGRVWYFRDVTEATQLRARDGERMRELEALYRADDRMYRSLRLDEVLQELVDVAHEMLYADQCVVYVWDERRERVGVAAAYGLTAEEMAERTYARDEVVPCVVSREGAPMTVEDFLAGPRIARFATDEQGINSMLTVPITVAGEVFGVFTASYCLPRTFPPEAQRLFLALAQRAAVAVENAQLYAQAQQAAVLEERQRLARDLHDAVTQTLFSASLIADVVPRLWERDQEESRRRLLELRQLTRGALAEMRTLLLELRPGSLTEMELGDLLRQLAEAFTGRTRVPVALQLEGEQAFPPIVQVALYRIAQEALNNVAKHAEASQVTLGLTCEANRAALYVRDDGRGFDPTQVPGGRLGMGSMRERAEAIAATLVVESRSGRGTEVSVVWTDGGGE